MSDGCFTNVSKILSQASRYYTWVKNSENSSAASKAPHAGQKLELEDVERGRDRKERGLVTIFEAKGEADDEETVTLGHWSDSRKTSDGV